MSFLLLSIPGFAQPDLLTLKRAVESSRVTLSAEALEPLLARAREVELNTYSEEWQQLFAPWHSPLLVDGKLYFVLTYDNPEVVDIVVTAYKNDVAREREYVRSLNSVNSQAVAGRPEIQAGGEDDGEGVQDFYDMFAGMVESTLSETIYDAMWDFPHPSSLRNLYIASVRPGDTIDRLAASQLGKLRNGEVVATDVLFYKETFLGVELGDAFVHLSNIVTLHPDVAQSRAPILRDFVERHVRHYMPQGSSHYIPWRDYRVRESAIQILSQIGTSADMPLLHEIGLDAPLLAPSKRIPAPHNLAQFASEVGARMLAKE